MKDGKNFPAFYDDPVRTCLNFGQNGFEFRATETECFVSCGIVRVFFRRQLALISRILRRRQLCGELVYEREGVYGRVDVEPEFLKGELW